MSEQKPLPKWADAETKKALEMIYGGRVNWAEGALIQLGMRIVLERLEKTREGDRAVEYPDRDDDVWNAGRESVRKEVLGE